MTGVLPLVRVLSGSGSGSGSSSGQTWRHSISRGNYFSRSITSPVAHMLTINAPSWLRRLATITKFLPPFALRTTTGTPVASHINIHIPSSERGPPVWRRLVGLTCLISLVCNSQWSQQHHENNLALLVLPLLCLYASSLASSPRRGSWWTE